MYPEIEPSERGMLDVGDGQQLYWESCGNPAGKPALVPTTIVEATRRFGARR